MEQNQHTLDGVERALRDGRLELSRLEHDDLKRRVARRVGSAPAGRGLRSRLALTLTLVVGLASTSAGGALAVSGISQSGDAGAAQYGTKTTPGGTVQGETKTGTIGTAGPTGSGDDVQSGAQVAASSGGDDGGGLPFTGYAGITALVVGLGLLGAGLALRRRTAAD